MLSPVVPEFDVPDSVSVPPLPPLPPLPPVPEPPVPELAELFVSVDEVSVEEVSVFVVAVVFVDVELEELFEDVLELLEAEELEPLL